MNPFLEKFLSQIKDAFKLNQSLLRDRKRFTVYFIRFLIIFIFILAGVFLFFARDSKEPNYFVTAFDLFKMVFGLGTTLFQVWVPFGLLFLLALIITYLFPIPFWFKYCLSFITILLCTYAFAWDVGSRDYPPLFRRINNYFIFIQGGLWLFIATVIAGLHYYFWVGIRKIARLAMIVAVSLVFSFLVAIFSIRIWQTDLIRKWRTYYSINIIANKCYRYYKERGQWPVGLENLYINESSYQLISDPRKLRDAWGGYFHFSAYPFPVLISYGADKKVGGTGFDTDIEKKFLSKKK